MSRGSVETPLLSIGNDRAELKLDGATGFIKDIHCKETGIHHKDEEDSGIWPFGFRLGDLYSPDLLRVEINASAKCASQEMTHELISEAGAETLRMHYDELKTTAGFFSGVKLTVDITLKEGADYFLITAKVENHGKYAITNLFSGWGGLVAGESRETERLATPDWSLGTIWDRPHESFQQRETFGYPIFGSQGCLTAGWIDLYGETGGIGIGYLNQQGLTMFFNVQSGLQIPNQLAPPKGEGLAFNWQLFNLVHGKANETLATVGGVYPLKPGERFATDPWILAPHAGDWHRMADIYRTEYEEAFQGDYLTWDETHDTAKKIDLTTFYNVTIDKDGPEKFNDVPTAIENIIERSGVEPESLMAGILAFWHSPLRFPDHFPRGEEDVNQAEAACKAMVDKLREMGVDAIPFFTHLFYNHPAANDYVAPADTDHDHENVIWNHIGNVVCMEEESWQALWREKYIPGYEAVEASGVMLDQGPTQYVVCSKEDHRHGTNGPAMLAAHTQGTLALLQAFKDGFTKRRCLLWTECSGDIMTRTCDIWSGWDGEPETGSRQLEIVRYTFPYRICAYTAFKPEWTVEDVNKCLVDAFLLGGYYGFDATEQWPESLDSAVRQYIKIRKELREKDAPGYPQGFKDTIGLTVGNADLVARVYRGDQGITVLYYAENDVETTVAADRAALGLPGQAEESFPVSLKKDEAGFKILR